jgi:hypothetical protein
MVKTMDAKDLWNSLKFSNQNKDGSLSMSKERVTYIDKILEDNPELICMKKIDLIKYKVQITPHFSLVIHAEDKEDAIKIVWKEVEQGYTYGYATYEEFVQKVTVTEVE